MLAFIILPLAGALTGWLIVSLLFKLLFRPVEPVILPFGNYKIQGIIPMKRSQIAKGLGQVLEAQLLCAVTESSGAGPALYHSMMESAVAAARDKISEKIPSILPFNLRKKLTDYAAEVFRREMVAFVDETVHKMSHDRRQTDAVCNSIEALIESYDLKGLQKEAASSAALFWIKAGAAGVGLISGLLQALMFFLISR